MLSYVVCMGGAMMSGLTPPNQVNEPMKLTVVKPALALNGRFSAVKDRAIRLIKSDKDLDEALTKLDLRIGESPLMIDVDFSRSIVVIICSGKDWDIDYTECEVLRGETALFIRYRNRPLRIELGASSKCSPFSILLLEKTQKEIVVEEDVREKNSDPPKLVTRERFKADDK